jgi:uncharacterized protein YcbK (DUF882 family)
MPPEVARNVAPDVEAHWFAHYSEVPKKLWRWKNFTPREMACRKTGSILVVPRFMDRLQALRTYLKRPLKINSGYRSPEHDRAIGGGGNHPKGRAADIGIFGDSALDVVIGAEAHGFTGIGVKQHGPLQGRFIHLDDLDDSETRGPRPHIWSYS